MRKIAFVFAALLISLNSNMTVGQGIDPPCPSEHWLDVLVPPNTIYHLYRAVSCNEDCTDGDDAGIMGYGGPMLDPTELGCDPGSGENCKCKTNREPVFVYEKTVEPIDGEASFRLNPRIRLVYCIVLKANEKFYFAFLTQKDAEPTVAFAIEIENEWATFPTMPGWFRPSTTSAGELDETGGAIKDLGSGEVFKVHSFR